MNIRKKFIGDIKYELNWRREKDSQFLKSISDANSEIELNNLHIIMLERQLELVGEKIHD